MLQVVWAIYVFTQQPISLSTRAHQWVFRATSIASAFCQAGLMYDLTVLSILSYINFHSLGGRECFLSNPNELFTTWMKLLDLLPIENPSERDPVSCP